MKFLMHKNLSKSFNNMPCLVSSIYSRMKQQGCYIIQSFKKKKRFSIFTCFYIFQYLKVKSLKKKRFSIKKTFACKLNIFLLKFRFFVFVCSTF
jgi:hypothetical protein